VRRHYRYSNAPVLISVRGRPSHKSDLHVQYSMGASNDCGVTQRGVICAFAGNFKMN